MDWGLPFGGAAVVGDYCQRHLEAFELGGEPTFALDEGCCASKDGPRTDGLFNNYNSLHELQFMHEA